MTVYHLSPATGAHATGMPRPTRSNKDRNFAVEKNFARLFPTNAAPNTEAIDPDQVSSYKGSPDATTAREPADYRAKQNAAAGG